MPTDRRQVIASFVLPLCLIVVPSDAVAQSTTPKPPSMDGGPTASASVTPPGLELQRLSLIAGELTGRFAAQGRPPRDSLKNGTIIGAVVGAVALGTFGAFLCNLEQEAGDPSCLPDVLRVAAVGAAIGAGAGLAVDAALSRHGGVTVFVGIRF
jgi:hypothetical protein